MEDEEGANASTEWRAAMNSSRTRIRPIPQRPAGKPVPPPPRRDDDHAPESDADRVSRRGPRPAKAPEPWEPELWVLEEDDLAREANRAVDRGRSGTPKRRGSTRPDPRDADIEAEVRTELSRSVGAANVEKLEVRLKDATRAFEAERFGDAARMLKKLADQAPGAASVRELYGLTLYRQAKWRLACKELEAFRLLTDSTEQDPVLADCYRALKRYAKVDELWQELRAASPSAELVTEGRIVAAGALGDQGDIRGAINLLEQGFSFPKRPKEHALRRAYALADCYERAGDVVRARELFRRIQAADRDFADVSQRIRSLR